MASELESLRLTKAAVTTYGMKQKIASLHTEMMNELKKRPAAKVISMKTILTYTMRIAAVLILLLGVSLLYQYYNATPDQLYKSNFESFQLRETRSISTASVLEALYKKGDANAVMNAFKSIPQPLAEDYFLEANAALKLDKPAEAIQSLLALQELNKRDNTHLYEEDADYYLAMAYMHDNQPSKALPLFEKIHNDEGHPYNKKVGTWFLRKVKRLAK